ncbi:MAG: class I SAM-dependent methyltransferase [Pirellulales bacterium]
MDAFVAPSPNAHKVEFCPLDFPLCWSTPRRLSEISGAAWVEHIPFAFSLVQMLRPQCLVELGVWAGDSYLAFCQAVEAVGLKARCYGVDHWKGDEQTGFFGPEVLAELRSHHDPCYGVFSRLIQSSFDDALAHFPDGDIDLLHIDGYHTYESVRHDFETWKPKLSPRGVVLFHDTNVRERGFGVWKFWSEIAGAYPHFEFFHGNGLGLLVVGSEASHPALSLTGLGESEAEVIRQFYFTLGHRATLQLLLRASQSREHETSREIARLQDAQRQSCAIQQRLEETERALADTRASISFRCGRALTFPLRRLVRVNR